MSYIEEKSKADGKEKVWLWWQRYLTRVGRLRKSLIYCEANTQTTNIYNTAADGYFGNKQRRLDENESFKNFN